MEKVDRLIKKFVLKRGLTGRLLANLVCRAANQIGRDDFRAISFKEGLLSLKAKDHLLAHKLYLKKEELLKTINQKLDYPAVKRIRVK